MVISPLAHGEESRFIEIFHELTLPNGMVLDRSSDPETVSCASTGFVSYAKAVAIDKGTLDRKHVEEVKAGFRCTIKLNPDKNRGWLYHFTDPAGNPKQYLFGDLKRYSEVSTIDSAIFYYSFLRAAQVLEDAEFEREVQDAIDKVDVAFMMKGDFFRHGFYRDGDSVLLIDWLWDDKDESVLLYKLFNKPFAPETDLDLPLFTYYYPLCFDRTDDQVETLKKAVKRQKERFGHIGITACDGPHGYQIGNPNVISPLSVYAASPFSDLAKQELESMPHSRMTPAVCGDWKGADLLGIDYASCYLVTRLSP